MISVKFFASLREQLGCEEIPLEMPDGREKVTVAEIQEMLVLQHVEWKTYLMADSIMIAVNHDMSKMDTSVSDGDEVAFFPPVTGG